MKEIKFLYETTIKKEVEEKVVEKEEQNGDKVEITRTIKKLRPIKLAIMRPGRKLFEEAEIYLARTINELIQAGLLPVYLINKRYNNDGGAMSDPEKKRIEELQTDALVFEKRYYEISASQEPEHIKEKDELIKKITKLNGEATDIQNAYANLFENSAEAKARNRLMNWWSFHLAYIDEDGKGYKPLFGDGDYTSKLEKYYDIEDSQDPFYIDTWGRFSYLVSFWISARLMIKEPDFKGMENIYQESISQYSPKEAIDAKVKEVPTTPAS